MLGACGQARADIAQCVLDGQAVAGEPAPPSRKRDAPDEPPSTAADDEELPADVRQRLAALRGSGVD
jgi:hypothetical protein